MSIEQNQHQSFKRIKRELVEIEHNVQNAAQLPKLRLLQWNILADGLAQHGDFIKVDPDVLSWSARLPLILAEIQDAQADVVCLQELNHFDDLLAALQPQGYVGVFLPKPSSPALNYNCPPDGVAVFFRQDRFLLMNETKCQVFQCSDGLRQNQGFLQLQLHDKLVHQDLLLVTTHLKAKEGSENDVIRLHQVQQLLESVCQATLTDEPRMQNGRTCGTADSDSNCNTPTRVSEVEEAPSTSHQSSGIQPVSQCMSCAASTLQNKHRCPIIVCGDFNDVPSSAACQAMQSHPLQFHSIWDHPVASPIGPEFSTWKYRSKGEAQRTIDYIWASQKHLLAPLARWRMPTVEEIGPTALPCARYASDHVALMCEFAWVLDSYSNNGSNGNGSSNGTVGRQQPLVGGYEQEGRKDGWKLH